MYHQTQTGKPSVEYMGQPDENDNEDVRGHRQLEVPDANYPLQSDLDNTEVRHGVGGITTNHQGIEMGF